MKRYVIYAIIGILLIAGAIYMDKKGGSNQHPVAPVETDSVQVDTTLENHSQIPNEQ